MILVTRLDGAAMILNSDQIAWIECSPDTVISVRGGEKLIVRESPDLLVARIVEFRRAIARPGCVTVGFPSAGCSGETRSASEPSGEEDTRSR